MTIKTNIDKSNRLAKLGPNLKRIRIQKGLTQEGFAERISVSSRIIYDYEDGFKNPSLNRVVIIAEVLGVTVDSLLR